MPWRKQPSKSMTFIAPDFFEVEERYVAPEESGTSRSTIIKVHSRDINKRQLDPRVVTLDSLLEQGITIDPGQVQSMLDITDPAEIESVNKDYCESAYKFLTEHKDEIFKSDVKSE